MSENKSICPLPFIHGHTLPDGERTLCCWADKPGQNNSAIVEKVDKLSDFWNNDYMKSVRVKMKNGEQIPDCHRCYFQESMGSESMRLLELKNYDTSYFLDKCDDEGNVNSNPEHFHYNSKTCNLQCLMCGPTHSTKHIALWEKMWSMPKGSFSTCSKEQENELSGDILESINSKECKRLYWSGGEPTMSRIHWNVMNRLMEVYEDDPDYVKSIYVEYNTNMTHFEYGDINIADFLEPIQPTIRASIDGVGDVFEYIRDGANWDEVEFNLRYYINKLNKKKQFTIDTILSAPVLMSLENYLDFFSQFDIVLRNHRLHDFSKDKSFKQMSVGFLDLRLYPIPIVKRLVEKGKDLISDSKIRGYERSIQILDSYVTERVERDEFFSDSELLGHIRYMTREEREPHNKSNHTIDKIMQKYDTECYEWFRSFQ